ncbi:MAG: HAD family hydrolase [Bdellovibrionales bacterium]
MGLNKFLILDFDGVLADSEIIGSEVEAEIKNKLGIAITLQEQISKFTGLAKNDPVMLEELSRLPANYWEIVDTRVGEVYRERLKPIKGTVEFLENLKMPRSIASNSEPDWLELKLEITGLKKFFGEFAFHRQLVKQGKPSPDLFLYALAKMGGTPSECLVVEDSVHGVRAGKAAGMTVCGFLGGAHVLPGYEERLRLAGADFFVSDLRDLEI